METRKFYALIYNTIVIAKPKEEKQLKSNLIDQKTNYPTSYSFDIIEPEEVRKKWPSMDSSVLYEIENKTTIGDWKKITKEIPSEEDRIFFLNASRNNPDDLKKEKHFYLRLEKYSEAGIKYLLADLSTEKIKEKNNDILQNIDHAEAVIKNYLDKYIKAPSRIAPYAATFTSHSVSDILKIDDKNIPKPVQPMMIQRP